MALTYTIAGLQSELDAYETARKARDWDTALDEYMDYRSVYYGLFESGGVDGATLKLPKPERLKEELEDAIGLADKISQRSKARVALTRTSRPAPLNRRPRWAGA